MWRSSGVVVCVGRAQRVRFGVVLALAIACQQRPDADEAGPLAQALELEGGARSLAVVPHAEPLPAPAPAPAPQPAPPIEDPLPPAPSGPTILVAGETGILELTIEGDPVRTIVSTAGRLPLRVPGTEQVVFVGLAAGGGTRDLRIVDVASATERAVAALALGAPCLPEAYAALDEDPPDVDVFDADDLWLSDSGKHACIVTSDGSPNARTFEEVHVVKLATGDVQRVLTFGGDECGRHSGEMPGACERVRNDSDDDDDDDDEPKPSAIGGVVDSVSPNGRWQLVLLASALGDVVHCQYALYRPSTAKSFPVASSPGKWPAAISPPVPRGVDAGEGEYIEGYPEFESAPTAWVGPHHLVIGRTLVVAGHRVITLPGDLVR